MDPLFVVVHETDSFLAINKAAGIGVHDELIDRVDADGGMGEEPDTESALSHTRTDGLISHLRKVLGDQHLFPVHRLDKDTSGLMLIAKGCQATKALSELFRLREIEKFYLAVCDKKGQKKQGTIKGGMVKGRRGSWMLSQSTDNQATTQFFSYGLEHGRRVVLLKPLSGKTHQLRVAMKANGSPILGDRRYGGSASDRMYLHAFRLVFELDGEPFDIETFPLRGEHFLWEGFRSTVKTLGAPELLKWPKPPPKRH